MSCDHLLMSYNGKWVGKTLGDTRTSSIYCTKCKDVWEVKRKNIEVERVGNLEDIMEDIKGAT